MLGASLLPINKRGHIATKVCNFRWHAGRPAVGAMSPRSRAATASTSARTAKYHLSKVFTKLNITSRIQLERVLT